MEPECGAVGGGEGAKGQGCLILFRPPPPFSRAKSLLLKVRPIVHFPGRKKNPLPSVSNDLDTIARRAFSRQARHIHYN